MRRSDALHARGRSSRAPIRARDDGGGRKVRRRNAGCIVRSRPAALSTNSRPCSATPARDDAARDDAPEMMMDTIDERADSSALELDDLGAALIAPEVARMVAAAADSASRHRYEELTAAVA